MTTSPIEQAAALIQSAPVFGLDVESTGLDPLTDRLRGIAVGLRKPVKKEWYFSFNGEHSLTEFQRCFAPIFADASKSMVAHNAKFDLEFLWQNGMRPSNRFIDSMIAVHLVDSDLPLKLDVLMKRLFKLKRETWKDVHQPRLFGQTFDSYAKKDVSDCLRLWDRFEPQIEELELSKLFHEMEMRLVPVIAEMELDGVLIDKDVVHGLMKEAEEEAEAAKADVIKAAGRTFNLNAAEQVSQLFFEELGLPSAGIPKGKKGAVSTKADWLEPLATKYPIVKRFLDYRKARKRNDTFLSALLETDADGRIHTNWKSFGARTGRMSSSDPNLQNIPIRTQQGRQIRRAFIPPKGKVLLDADYSQIELRLAAHITRDPILMEAFQRGEDVHQRTADELGVTRYVGKTMNFALIYGMLAWKLAHDLGCTEAEAELYRKKFFGRLRGISEFHRRCDKVYEKATHVRTLAKRRRPLGKLTGRKRWKIYVNTIIQGSAADVIKVGMRNVWERLRSESRYDEVRLLAQIHDEVLLEVPKAQVPEVSELVKEELENAMRFRVPLVVDVATGMNWLECKS